MKTTARYSLGHPELFAVSSADRGEESSASNVSIASDRASGRGDNDLVEGEREVMWPPCVLELSFEDRMKLFGDVPRRTRLKVQEVCRRLHCDSNTVYRHIETGDLVAANIAPAVSVRPAYRIYRWSLIELLWRRLEGANENEEEA